MGGNEFSLWAKKVNRDIMSRCLNGPTGCMADCHLMRNSGLLKKKKNCDKCREALYVFVMCSWDSLVAELVRRGRCVMSESDWLRPRACWLLLTRGPIGGFGALDWVDVCHAHVMPPLPDEPCSYAINTIIASKCIYLICETETVLLDLWCKARFN